MKTAISSALSLAAWATAVSLAGCTGEPTADDELSQAALARPNFQAPFPCGQEIRMESFAHAPAVDIFRVPTEATEGNPLIAPAAGVVNQSYSAPSGAGNIIQINHGGGWFTTYIHLQSRAVSVGARVKQGDPIGRIGHTGVTSNGVSHVHFEMAVDKNGDGRADWGAPNPERVPPVFNGVTYGQRNSQSSRLISKNCGGPSGSAAALPDINGDGRFDLVGLSATDSGGTNITTWLSNGTGFGGGNPGESGAPFGALRATLGDVNGDGVADLIGALPGDSGGTNFIVSLGTSGSAGFRGFGPAGTTAGVPSRIYSGDVNGDGLDDVVGVSATGTGGTNITTWLSQGTGFGGGNPGESAAPFADLRLAVGDVNGDGVIDLIGALSGASGGTNFIVSSGIRGSAGFGGFGAAGTTAGVPSRIHAGDINGDGRDDIVGLSATGTGTTNITTWLSTGTGFGGGNPGESGALFSGLHTALGDVNADGVVDLIGALPRDSGGTNFMVSLGTSGSVAFRGFQAAGSTAGVPSDLLSR